MEISNIVWNTRLSGDARNEGWTLSNMRDVMLLNAVSSLCSALLSYTKADCRTDYSRDEWEQEEYDTWFNEAMGRD